MIRTITLGRYISVQGLFESMAEDGTIVVRVGAQTYRGMPVS